MTSVQNIWEKYHLRLKRYIQQKISDPVLSEDIFQDVFLKVQANITTLKDESKIEPWLFKVTRFTIIDAYRTRKLTTLPEEFKDNHCLENKIETKQGITGLKVIIDSLPEKYAQILILSEFDKLTQKEISEKLGLSLPGTKSRLLRAKKLLGQKLEIFCSRTYDRHGEVIDVNCTDCFSNIIKKNHNF